MISLLGSVLLVGVSFVVPFASSTVRRDSRYCFAVLMLLTLYCGVSFTNAFLVGVKGAGSDAVGFHNAAVRWSINGEWTFATSADLYVQLLGTFYSVFGTSIFVGQQLSIIAFAFTTILLKKFIDYFDANRHRIAILLLFGLLPSMLFRASATLREVYEVLLIMLTVYCGLRMVVEGSARSLVWFAVSTACLAISHKALTVFAMVSALVFALARQPTGRRFAVRANKLRVLGIGSVLCIGVVLLVMVFGQVGGLRTAQVLLTADTQEVDRVLTHKSTKEARATYGTEVQFSSFSAFATTFPLSFTYYHLAPLPWQVRAPIDLYGMLVGLLRLCLLFGAFAYWRRSRGRVRRAATLMLVLYLALASIWATGTANFGTADRHNLTHMWILILLGYPMVVEKLRRKLGLRTSQRRVVGRSLAVDRIRLTQTGGRTGV